MKNLLVLFLLSIFSFASSIQHINSYEQGIEKAKKENKQALLFVYSTYCPWCKKMEKTTLQDEEVIKVINEKYIFIAVNQDKDSFPEKFIPYGVPTTYLIDPIKEEKIFTMKGYKSADSFLDRLGR